jgi:hypothetical protein
LHTWQALASSAEDEPAHASTFFQQLAVAVALTKAIADSVISGRKSGAEMARLYNISSPTVSRIIAQHRSGPA